MATELFPLSMAQITLITSMLANSDYENNPRLNTLTCCFEWRNGSVEMLQCIGNSLLEWNDAFRLHPVYRFPWHWRQYVRPFSPQIFPVLDFSTESEYESWLCKEKNRGIDLLKDRLCVIRILCRPEGRFTLWIQMHHFLTDGYSMKLIARQIREFQKAYQTGGKPLLPAPGSYREYVEKENAYRHSPQFLEDRAFWKNVFRYRKVFAFPAGSRSMQISCDADTVSVKGDLYHQLCAFCQTNSVSVSSVIISCAAVLTWRLTAKPCFSMSVLNYGRNDAVLRRTMGCMMNNPVLIYDIDPKKSFSELCRMSYRQNLEMLRHVRFSSLDFTPLSYPLCTLHGMNYNYSWILFSQMDYESAFRDGEPKGRMFWSNTNVSQFYAAIFDVPKEDHVTIELRYQNKRFSPAQIRRILDAFYGLLDTLVRVPEQPMEDALSGQ